MFVAEKQQGLPLFEPLQHVQLHNRDTLPIAIRNLDGYGRLRSVET